jgi:hypothetical protein
LTDRPIADNGPMSDGADRIDRIAVSPDGRLLAGDLSGADAGGLIDLSNGRPVQSDADIPMRGSGLWAMTDAGSLIWAGRPPTYPSAILRWFDLPTPSVEPDLDPDK